MHSTPPIPFPYAQEPLACTPTCTHPRVGRSWVALEQGVGYVDLPEPRDVCLVCRAALPFDPRREPAVEYGPVGDQSQARKVERVRSAYQRYGTRWA